MLFSAAFSVALFLANTAITLASPSAPSGAVLKRANKCTPQFDKYPYNFRKNSVRFSTVNGVESGKPVKSSRTEKALFTIKKERDSPAQFSLTYYNQSAISLSIGGDGFDSVIIESTATGNVNQLFTFECMAGCAQGNRVEDEEIVGDDCQIRSVAIPEKCVQVESTGTDDPFVELAPCPRLPIDTQLFQILKTTNGIPVPPDNSAFRTLQTVQWGGCIVMGMLAASLIA